MESNYGWHWVGIWLIVFWAGMISGFSESAWVILPVMIIAALTSRAIFAHAVNSAEKSKE